MGNHSSNAKQAARHSNRSHEDSGPEYIGAPEPPEQSTKPQNKVTLHHPHNNPHPPTTTHREEAPPPSSPQKIVPTPVDSKVSQKKRVKKETGVPEPGVTKVNSKTLQLSRPANKPIRKTKSLQKIPSINSTVSVKSVRKPTHSPGSQKRQAESKKLPSSKVKVSSQKSKESLKKFQPPKNPKTTITAGRTDKQQAPPKSPKSTPPPNSGNRNRSDSSRALARGFVWVTCYNGNCPKHAVEGGNIFADKTLVRSLVIARAYVGSELVPGYFDTRDKVCCVSWGGHPHKVTEQYQVLSALPGQFRWRQSQDGVAEADAVEGGLTSDGEVLLIGRAQGELLLHKFLATGRIQPSRKCLYIANGYKLTIPKEDEDPNLLKGHFKLVLSDDGTEDYHDTYQYLAHPSKAELTKAVRSTRSFFSKSLP